MLTIVGQRGVRDRHTVRHAVESERFIRPGRQVRPAARAEAYLRLDTLTGEQAQVDWGNFGDIRVGATTPLLSCFVLVLAWSRAGCARFALNQTIEGAGSEGLSDNINFA